MLKTVYSHDDPLVSRVFLDPGTYPMENDFATLMKCNAAFDDLVYR
jgi:hypothetical protein